MGGERGEGERRAVAYPSPKAKCQFCLAFHFICVWPVLLSFREQQAVVVCVRGCIVGGRAVRKQGERGEVRPPLPPPPHTHTHKRLSPVQERDTGGRFFFFFFPDNKFTTTILAHSPSHTPPRPTLTARTGHAPTS